MVDERRGSQGEPEGQQLAGLAAGLGWVLPCLGALGTGAALGALCAFQGNVGLRRGFWLILRCSQTCLNFKVAACPGLSGTAVGDACRVGIISSTSFTSPRCPGVFGTQRGSYASSPAVGRGFRGSLSPEGRWGSSWCCCETRSVTLVYAVLTGPNRFRVCFLPANVC